MRSARDNLKLFDDLAKMATGALGSFGDVREQVRKLVKERVDQALSKMELVTREEFERVEALAERARERQEDLEDRLKALEKSLKTKAAPKQEPKAAKGKKK
ncbi:MAG: accessory factor UbiK family protein [bacterium]|nr:accessory factor UbiK family protein [bacterium]